MKATFNIQHSTSNIQRMRRRRTSALNVECSMLNVECSRRSSRGVALIVTLIMLAVITFMATTFLVLSRRETNSVTTNTDQTKARFTADTALERAKAQLLAGIIANTNDQNFDLMVPTNFFNPYGFDPAAVDYRTNVNYNYLSTGGALSAAQQQRNIANLLYDPRPPVFITNTKVTNDFRYYLDLNRNGRFDDTGSISNVINVAGTLVTNGNIAMIGDPQWIGVLRFPDRPHSADNPFESRWTYIVLPAGKTLDVNYLGNQAATRTVNPFANVSAAFDGFARNQGVGTWEINLAALLADLNTNIWNLNTAPYTYRQADLSPLPNKGTAFDDARALLSYRYNYSYATLTNAIQLFANPQVQSFRTDNIDEYSDGPFMYGTVTTGEAGNQDDVSKSWAGSDNVNHFFTTQDFFDRNKVGNFVPSFADRLTFAGTTDDTYNRYTFYRMLAQLGTDSSPPVEDKININYRNVTNGVVVSGMETNLYAWSPLEFFTNSAARMFEKLNLRDNNGNLVTVANIPVWPTNFYTPAVHRIMQLSANMFEATTNCIYPSIYKPLFSRQGINLYISGYELVNGPDNYPPQPTPGVHLTKPKDLNLIADRATVGVVPTRQNFYGVPWVIGARKGLPNFNLVTMQTASQITRKLKMRRRTVVLDPTEMAQLFVVGISNVVGVSVWNSYAASYPRPVYIFADGLLTMSITNNLGARFPAAAYAADIGGVGSAITLGVQQWQGSGWVSGSKNPPNVNSFQVPLFTNYVFLPDAAYEHVTKQFVLLPPATPDLWPNNLGNTPASWPQPMWQLDITNQIRCMIFDGGSGGRIIDYVQLGGLDDHRSLSQELQALPLNSNDHSINNLWGTNMVTYQGFRWPVGIQNQFDISRGNIVTSDTDWQNNLINTPIGQAKINAIAYFKSFVGDDDSVLNTNLIMQFPFCPTAKRCETHTWGINDPLVHYLTTDLNNLQQSNIVNVIKPPVAPVPDVATNLNALSPRYSPWGGSPIKDARPSAQNPLFMTSVKDPLVRNSDDWNFPTNKLPNMGWLGRVHRGTPWQTVYLKSADTNGVDWPFWSGDSGSMFWTNKTSSTPHPTWSVWNGVGTFNNVVRDATLRRPIEDRKLFEVFTTSLNDNAARGQLSINQANLAAWSAVLSGVIALTNDPVNFTIGPIVISPAGVYSNSAPFPALAQIVEGINRQRTNFLDQTFANLGDVLATPELTDVSPYLVTNGLSTLRAGGITDEVMERIPQQIMSLLTVGSPRFVIYSYGQTLHPANNSIVTFGTFNGLCTNYQVTAETATRAVIRVDGGPDKPHIVVEQYNILPPD